MASLIAVVRSVGASSPPLLSAMPRRHMTSLFCTRRCATNSASWSRPRSLHITTKGRQLRAELIEPSPDEEDLERVEDHAHLIGRAERPVRVSEVAVSKDAVQGPDKIRFARGERGSCNALAIRPPIHICTQGASLSDAPLNEART